MWDLSNNKVVISKIATTNKKAPSLGIPLLRPSRARVICCEPAPLMVSYGLAKRISYPHALDYGGCRLHPSARHLEKKIYVGVVLRLRP